MKERKPGLDLIRCLGLLLVVTFHSYLNNGYYFESQRGIWMILAGGSRWFSTACNGLFLMLTGWLKSQSTDVKSCWRGIPGVLTGYLLAALISIPVRHFLLGDRKDLGTWISLFFQFRGIYYGWYVEMYVGLILLAPFVNKLLHALDKTELILGAAIMVLLTALPGVHWIFPDYWRDMYPLTYYLLGALIRRLDLRIPTLWGVLGAAATAFTLGAATVISTDQSIYEAAVWEFGDLWITVIVFLLFSSLYHLKVTGKTAKILCFGASGCYGGYLLSHLLDDWCYRLFSGWHRPEYYWLLFLCVTIPIYAASVAAGMLLERFSGVLTRRRRL